MPEQNVSIKNRTTAGVIQCTARSAYETLTAVTFYMETRLNPVSQKGGGGLLQPLPFRIFPRAVFAQLFCSDFHSINLPTLYPDTHSIYEKISKNFAVKKIGGWGVATTLCPEREGVAAEKSNFPNFDFIIYFLLS